MARANQAGARDFVRYDYEYSRLPSISDVERDNRRISVQPSSGDDVRARILATRIDDVYSFSRLLPAEAIEKRRKHDGGARNTGIYGVLLPGGKICDRSSLACFWGIAALSSSRRIFRASIKDAVFPGRCAVPVVLGRMAAE